MRLVDPLTFDPALWQNRCVTHWDHLKKDGQKSRKPSLLIRAENDDLFRWEWGAIKVTEICDVHICFETVAHTTSRSTGIEVGYQGLPFKDSCHVTLVSGADLSHLRLRVCLGGDPFVSGRESAMKPSRLGMRTAGNDL
jgi:hypothetical protein